MAWAYARLAVCAPCRGYTGARLCAHPSEDVREPSVLCHKLIDMGAQIILCDPHRAVVIGQDHRIRLRAGRMTSPDIRAGIALLIAAMSANGTSRIDNIQQIDRGYENIDIRLNELGAHIERVDD